jgi:hypothetical protein
MARVTDHVERKASLIRQQFSIRGVEDDNLPDASPGDLRMP